jgi:hypothetical protein
MGEEKRRFEIFVRYKTGGWQNVHPPVFFSIILSKTACKIQAIGNMEGSKSK